MYYNSHISQNSKRVSKKQRREEKNREMSLITEEMKAKAEIWYGSEIGQEKCKFLLTEAHLPNGLIPIKDIEECGYIKETGFVWLKQKKRYDHRFEKIGGKLVSYAAEVTAYVEERRLRKLTGVKVKELLIWIPLAEFYVGDPPTKITFKIPSGLSRSYPVSAFELDEEEVKNNNNNKEETDQKKNVKEETDQKKNNIIEEIDEKLNIKEETDQKKNIMEAIDQKTQIKAEN